MKRVSILLTMIALSVGIAYAGGNTTRQNFDEMYNKTLFVTNSNTVGTTDFVTYTCSGGTAKFFLHTTYTYGEVCIFLTGSGATVTTTPVQDLDSLTIYYYPDGSTQSMKVYTKEGEGSWEEQTVVQKMVGISTVKFPRTGNYALKIQRDNTDIYLRRIDYTVAPPCNCLRVVSE